MYAKALRRRRRSGQFLPYLLLTPALILLVGMVYPFALGLYYSFTDYWLQFPKRFRFIGLGNYIGLLNRPLFSRALEFTLGYTLVAVIIQVGLGLAVALFLHANIPGRKVLRAMMLMPLMISTRDRRADVEGHDGFERVRNLELRIVVHRREPGELAWRPA